MTVWWRRIGEGYAAALFLVYGAMLLGHGAAPSLTDYADWTYQGVLLHLHLTGGMDAAHALKHYPVPNSAATVGVGLLCFVLPWKLAADVWLCLQLLVSFLVTRHIMRTLTLIGAGAPAALWFLVPTATYLNMNLWYGFVNFQMGVCWVVLLASLLLRGVATAEWVLGAMLLVAFFTHMIPFAFCGLLLVLYSLQVRRLRLLWQLAPAAALSVWYLVGRFLFAGDADGQAGMEATARWGTGAFWLQKVNSFAKSFGFVNPVSLHGSVVSGPLLTALFAVNALLCGAMAVVLIRSGLAAWRGRRLERFVWLAMLLMLPVSLLAPGAALGVSDPGARVLQTMLAAGVVLCSGRLLRVSALCAVTLGIASVALLAWDGFGAEMPAAGGAAPEVVRAFGRVPNHGQDYFYTAIERRDRSLRVFPTGLFVNR